jgi:hypothetical protein
MTARARAGALVFLVLATGALCAVFAFALWSTDSRPGPARAVIIDQASLTQPNPSLVWTATSRLAQAGYQVDYIPGEQVTVDFYRRLPEQGYDLLLIRTHSGLVGEDQQQNQGFIFTSEIYDQTKYVEDQYAHRLIIATYATVGEGQSVALRDIPRVLRSPLFGLAPEFFRSGVRGSFDGALVILMGCNGLTTDSLAAAIAGRGASQVLSWDGPVSADHTDAATERLLAHLFEERLSVDEAVARTMADVGPDPSYQSVLRVYPSGG